MGPCRRAVSGSHRIAGAVSVSYAGRVNRRIPQPPPPRLAHERAILDNWKEDDGVYVTLRAVTVGRPFRGATLTPAHEAATGPGAADAEPGSPEAPAFLPPPTPR